MRCRLFENIQLFIQPLLYFSTTDLVRVCKFLIWHITSENTIVLPSKLHTRKASRYEHKLIRH